MFYFTFKIF